MVKIALVLILFLAAVLRLYQLGNIPAGIHGDEASQAYNAYSLIQTGKDRYGEVLPILFRSLGSYQPAVYTYLATMPVALIGNNIISSRIVSALSGVTLVLLTYLVMMRFAPIKHKSYGLVGALFVAVSPWSVFFSRLAIEANLALAIFAGGILFLLLSIKRAYLFVVGCFLLGMSTQAYYSERVVVLLCLATFIYLYKDVLLKKKTILLLSLGIFILTQLPHFYMIQTGAYLRRFDQVSYVQEGSGVGQVLNWPVVFLENYLLYFRPRMLFFDSDSELGRTMPGLSVFYGWMAIPLIVGFVCIFGRFKQKHVKLLFLMVLFAPIPAALTGDVFYPLRTLDFLWLLTIVAALGAVSILSRLEGNLVKVLVVSLVLAYSLGLLCVSYFVLFKYEKAKYFGYSYIRLLEVLKGYPDRKVLVDSARDSGIGVRFAYLSSYDPKLLQAQLRPQMKTAYYNSFVNADEVYTIDNITVAPINWVEICDKDLLVGDIAAISDSEMEKHHLVKKFEVLDLSGSVGLRGFEIGRDLECRD